MVFMLQQYKTLGGVHVEFSQQELNYQQGIDFLLESLDSQRGAVFASSFEYPGRYTCWDMGFYNPPLVMICQSNTICFEALNQRGEILLSFLYPLLKTTDLWEVTSQTTSFCQLKIKSSDKVFSEEERSHQPSVFSAIRLLLNFLKQKKIHTWVYMVLLGLT